MKISGCYLDRIGVDRAAWHRVAINPYGRIWIRRPPRPQPVRLHGGPLDGATVSLYQPEAGTLPLRGGQYLPPVSGRREPTESPHWLIWHASREGM